MKLKERQRFQSPIPKFKQLKSMFHLLKFKKSREELRFQFTTRESKLRKLRSKFLSTKTELNKLKKLSRKLSLMKRLLKLKLSRKPSRKWKELFTKIHQVVTA